MTTLDPIPVVVRPALARSASTEGTRGPSKGEAANTGPRGDGVLLAAVVVILIIGLLAQWNSHQERRKRQ